MHIREIIERALHIGSHGGRIAGSELLILCEAAEAEAAALGFRQGLYDTVRHMERERKRRRNQERDVNIF